MTSTEERVKNVIRQHQGKVHKQQIARELKISLDYLNFIVADLQRKEEIVLLPGGLYSLAPLVAECLPAAREKTEVVSPPQTMEKPAAMKGAKSKVKPQSKTRKIKLKLKKEVKKISPLTRLFLTRQLGISDNLARILSQAGFKTAQAVADTPVVRLVEMTGLELSEAAGAINKARKILS